MTPKTVVVHHAHHEDEGVYRLVFATQHELRDLEANPEWDREAHDAVLEERAAVYNARLEAAKKTGNLEEPTEDELPSYDVPMVVEKVRLHYTGHQEIVWADDDEQWEGMEPGEIAAAQRSIVSRRLTEIASERERAEMAAERATKSLGGLGESL